MPSRSGDTEIVYRLPDSLRSVLAEPFGPVYASERELEGRVSKPLIAVGDQIAASLLKAAWRPHLVIYDGKTQRANIDPTTAALLKAARGQRVRVENPAGSITKDLWNAVAEAFTAGISPWIIEVQGEEDLAGLPCMIHAPLDATVIYGIPNRGVCPVRITPEVKQRAQDILTQMKA